MLKLCLFALAEELYLALMPLRLLTQDQLRKVAVRSEYECARTSSRAERAESLLNERNALAHLSDDELRRRFEHVYRANIHAEESGHDALRHAAYQAWKLTGDEVVRRMGIR